MFINNMDFYNTISDDKFIQAIFSFDLTLHEINQIEKEYTVKNKGDLKKLDETVVAALGKKIKEPRVTYEWTLEDYQNEDVELV